VNEGFSAHAGFESFSAHDVAANTRPNSIYVFCCFRWVTPCISSLPLCNL